MTLVLHQQELRSVFQLVGTDENSASYALGWALEQSPALRRQLLAALRLDGAAADGLAITLQQPGDDSGFTDIELQAGQRLHVLIEAKAGWRLPGAAQLARYLPRLQASGAQQRRLVTLSSAGRSYAASRLPTELDGVTLSHLAWSDVQALARQAHAASHSTLEKLWLSQLAEHLQEYVAMRQLNDNRVFVVSLASGLMPGCARSWIDVVERDGCYFHRVGNRWPVQPPTYIGFRYAGRLQSVHHIDSFVVVNNLADYDPAWMTTDHESFVYRLGPAMHPAREMRTGSIMRNNRVWCEIDTLLAGQYATLSEAHQETKRRAGAVSPPL
jgi:hypothetical protein